jgi:hypothetical protein
MFVEIAWKAQSIALHGGAAQSWLTIKHVIYMFNYITNFEMMKKLREME